MPGDEQSQGQGYEDRADAYKPHAGSLSCGYRTRLAELYDLYINSLVDNIQKAIFSVLQRLPGALKAYLTHVTVKI